MTFLHRQAKQLKEPKDIKLTYASPEKQTSVRRAGSRDSRSTSLASSRSRLDSVKSHLKTTIESTVQGIGKKWMPSSMANRLEWSKV